jgi:ribosomal protein S18
VILTLYIQEKQKRKAAAIKRAKNGKDKSKAKDGEEVDKDMIRKFVHGVKRSVTNKISHAGVEHLNYKVTRVETLVSL